MMRDDRGVRVLLGVIAILLALNLLVQISGLTGPRLAVAAGIPDSGAQRQSLIEKTADISKKIADTNKKIDDLHTFLKSGGLTHQVKEMPKCPKRGRKKEHPAAALTLIHISVCESMPSFTLFSSIITSISIFNRRMYIYTLKMDMALLW